MTTEEDKYTRAKTPRILLILFTVVLISVGYYLKGDAEIRDLEEKTGLQWDSEMRGDWVRESGRAEGVEIYRLHFSQGEHVIGPENRRLLPGVKLACSLHFRVASPGKYQARVLLLGANDELLAESEKSPILVDQGAYSQFRGIALVLKTPTNLTGSVRFRLEVTAIDGAENGFWETDLKIE